MLNQHVVFTIVGDATSDKQMLMGRLLSGNEENTQMNDVQKIVNLLDLHAVSASFMTLNA